MSDYDLNELLDLLEREDLKKEIPEKPKKKLPNSQNVLDFIEDYGIENGKILVPNYMIYYVYKTEWGGRSKRTKMNKRAFFQTFSTKFKQKRTAKFRGYLLNDCFGLTDKKLNVAYEYDQKLEKLRGTRRKTEKEKQKEERSREKRIAEKRIYN